MVKIALDIGHGSNTFDERHSKGVIRNGKKYEEHTANSKLAKKIKKRLEDHGFEVIMYQKPNSREIPLRQRTDYYNSIGVDLVWSIHFNAGNPSISGVCSFYWHTSENGKRVAQTFAKIAEEFGLETHGDGTHASKVGSWTNMHICRETSSVAVLVENGFMTSPEDFKNIFLSDEYHNTLAEVHTKAILTYFGYKYHAPKDEDIVTIQEEPIEKEETDQPPKPSDDGLYRLATGAFPNAEAVSKARKKIREEYNWMLYEKADDLNFDPTLRVWTGTFKGRNVAEYFAEELKDKFGWQIYIKKG